MEGTIKIGPIYVRRLPRTELTWRRGSEPPYDEIRIDGIEFPAILGDCQPKHLEKRLKGAVYGIVDGLLERMDAR